MYRKHQFLLIPLFCFPVVTYTPPPGALQRPPPPCHAWSLQPCALPWADSGLGSLWSSPLCSRDQRWPQSL